MTGVSWGRSARAGEQMLEKNAVNRKRHLRIRQAFEKCPRTKDKIITARTCLGGEEEKAIGKDNGVWREASMKSPYHQGGIIHTGR